MITKYDIGECVLIEGLVTEIRIPGEDPIYKLKLPYVFGMDSAPTTNVVYFKEKDIKKCNKSNLE